MYAGKTLFAQIMDFLPWSTFQRIVKRYGGDHRVRRLPCTEQFRVMAFAQLTYRESLRDIETCPSAQTAKLYHMGLRQAIRRATLADANDSRDWRIYADFAQRLMARDRKLYAADSLDVDLANTVYALDSSTIDVCLSMFSWAHFSFHKAAVKLHTLLDGKLHDVNVFDLLLPEAGAFYVMDRAYVDFARLYRLDQFGSFFVTRAKRNLNARRLYSAPVDRSTGLICDQTIALNNFYAAKDYPAHLRRYPLPRSGNRPKSRVLDQPHALARADNLRSVSQPMAGGVVPQMDQTASSHQALLRHVRKCGQVADLDRRASTFSWPSLRRNSGCRSLCILCNRSCRLRCSRKSLCNRHLRKWLWRQTIPVGVTLFDS